MRKVLLFFFLSSPVMAANVLIGSPSISTSITPGKISVSYAVIYYGSDVPGNFRNSVVSFDVNQDTPSYSVAVSLVSAVVSNAQSLGISVSPQGVSQ